MAITTDQLDLQFLKACFQLDHFSNFNMKSVAAIQIFAIAKEYATRSFDLLADVFQQFPTVDYALVTVPKGKNTHINSLLKAMVRVVPKTHSSYPHELFLCHRDSILENFSVRTIEEADVPKLKALIDNPNSKPKLVGGAYSMGLVKSLVETGVEPGSELKLHGFVVTVFDQLVGLCILRDEEDIEYLRAHFDIEKFMHWNSFYRNEHARIQTFILQPHFLPLVSTFMREVMRLSKKAALYKTIYGKDDKQESFSSCTQDLLPVMARRQIEYDEGELENFGDNAPSQRVLKQQYPTRSGEEAFSLLHINKKLTMHTKLPVQDQIVVLGASDVAMTFLKELIYQPHLCFTNLILVSGQRDDAQANAIYSDDDIVKLGLNTWVNVVHGRACELNREKNYIALENGTRITYDNLIIATGLEYTLSNFESNFNINIKPPTSTAKPGNKILLTGFNEDSLHFIENHSSKSEITLAVNNANTSVLPESIQQEMLSTIQKAPYNVTYKESKITDVSSTFNKTVVNFGADGNDEFDEVYGFCSKRIDPVTFRMFNDACLVTDSKLVIDNKFRTNDANIFAAGSCTKYARHYHNLLDQCEYNSRAIGEKLAKMFMELSNKNFTNLARLDPNGDLNQLPSIENIRVEDFSAAPLKTHTTIPGGFEVFSVRHVINQKSTTVSSNIGTNQVCNIDLDANGNVVGVFACRNDGKKLCTGNLQTLFGKHEKIIHDLKFRQSKEPSDLFEFLKTASLQALYHDRFEELLAESNDILKMGGIRKQIEEVIANVELTDDKRESLKKVYQDSQLKEQVEDLVTAWLNYNRNHLPMYAKPGAV